ncbi:hypothetical protein SRHO_G00006190 [Serrasalmus rhombeus]
MTPLTTTLSVKPAPHTQKKSHSVTPTAAPSNQRPPYVHFNLTRCRSDRQLKLLEPETEDDDELNGSSRRRVTSTKRKKRRKRNSTQFGKPARRSGISGSVRFNDTFVPVSDTLLAFSRHLLANFRPACSCSVSCHSSELHQRGRL